MMTKEFDRVGIPVVQICTITPIAQTVGANRIVKAIAIPHPIGNPQVSKEEEYEQRKKIVMNGIEALKTDIKEQTIFNY